MIEQRRQTKNPKNQIPNNLKYEISKFKNIKVRIELFRDLNLAF